MSVLFQFAIGFTSHRPLQADEHTAYVSVLGEDSASGLSDAQWTAIAMVSGAHITEMVTSVQLVAAEV